MSSEQVSAVFFCFVLFCIGWLVISIVLLLLFKVIPLGLLTLKFLIYSICLHYLKKGANIFR